MKLILLSGIFLTLVSFTITDTDIVGVWESKGTTGNIIGLRLKKDGTFSSYINKKAFTTGQYTFSDDTMTVMEDNGCMDTKGAKIKAVAKLVFFAPDSFRIEIITDDCEDRRKGVDGSRYGRVVNKE
jgi:hypothetical protein